jgi:hypothetical protein
MRLMRRHDRQKQEDGYGLLRAHAAEHLDEVIAEFGREQDHGLRCWLLELVGEARSPRAIALLVDQLHSPNESLRYWAATGLQQLDIPEARQAVHQARVDGLIT